nr:hypothetical protein BaRGS_015607 [Batillaria attramentaria]
MAACFPGNIPIPILIVVFIIITMIIVVGKVPDTCFASNFTIGDEVLAYLNRHEDGRFSPTYTESPAGYKDEIFSACGIAIEYPGNLKPEDAPYNCDDDADYLYDEATCLRYQPKDKVEEIDVKVPSDDGKVDMGQPEPGDKQGDQNNDQQKTNEVEEIDVKVPSDDGKVDMGQPEPGDKQGDQSYDQQKTNDGKTGAVEDDDNGSSPLSVTSSLFFLLASTAVVLQMS